MSTRSPDDLPVRSDEYVSAHVPPHLDARADRTLAQLAAATADLHARTSELHDALCEFVAQLKDEGLPAERVVVVIKAALAKAGIRKGSPAADALVDDVVTACIEAYYKPS